MATANGYSPGCGGPGDEGDFLLRQGKITREDLDAARQASNDPIQWLIDQGIVGEEALYQSRAMRMGMAFVDLNRIPVLFDAYMLSLEQALELAVLPLKKDGDNIWAAFKDSKDQSAIDRIAQLTGCRVIPVMAAPAQIDATLDRYRKNLDLWPSGPPSRDPGRVLVLKEYVTEDQLTQARASSDDPIRWLLETDIIGEHEFAMARAWEHQMMYMGFSDGSFRNRVSDEVPQQLARELGILPLGLKDGVLRIAVSDPRDWASIQRAEQATGLRMNPTMVMRKRDLVAALSQAE